MHVNFTFKTLGKCLKQTVVDGMLNKYFNFYPHSTIGYWHDTVVSPSVRPSSLSVTQCIVAKLYILQQKCLNNGIGSVP